MQEKSGILLQATIENLNKAVLLLFTWKCTNNMDLQKNWIYIYDDTIGLKWVKNLSNIYVLQDKSCCSTSSAVNHEDLKASGLIIQLRFSFLHH